MNSKEKPERVLKPFRQGMEACPKGLPREKARKNLPRFLRNFADTETISEMVDHFDRESY